MTTYVCGFLFNPERTHVALIRKTKPEWQAGKLNGIGGKVEHGETLWRAVQREFQEETGAVVDTWDYPFAELAPRWDNGTKIFFFRAFGNPLLRSPTEEAVDWYPLADLPALDVIPNLRWLIPLALDRSTVLVRGEFIPKEVA